MKPEIRGAIRAGILVLVIGFLTIIVVAMFGLENKFSSVFPFPIILAAVLLGVIYWLKRWERFPVGPLLGVLIASIGYASNSSFFMYGGFFVFSIFTVWQSHQLEGRRKAKPRQ